MAYSDINKEVLSEISKKIISGKPVNWSFIERICNTFEDVLKVVNYCISIGASFYGLPSERTEKYLNEHGININDLCE